MKKLVKNDTGFTLIELLVVVAIIGILAAIAIPQFAEYRARGFDSRALSDLRNAATAEEAYFADTEAYVDCSVTGGGGACGPLPGFVASKGVTISMADVAATGSAPEHFTGSSYHTNGSRTSTNPYSWDSSAGGLQ